MPRTTNQAHAPFGTYLRRLRDAAALSQDDLATRSGLSARAISDLERGVRQRPRPESLRLLADALALEGVEREAFVASAGLERRSPVRPYTASRAAPLPPPSTRLLGRERELTELSTLVCQPDVPLVTLTGLGGVGKTRLAMAVAHQVAAAFHDGAVFVDLAPLTDPALILPTIAAALDVHAVGDALNESVIVQALCGQELLLLLDNCEHLVPDVADIAGMLIAHSGITLLTTSREALKLRAEREWPILPFALPDLSTTTSLAEIARSPAVMLFVERTRAVDPQFTLTEENAQAVAEICHRVDGIPLAIELAAGRSKLFSPQHLAGQLEHRLPLLTGGAHDAPSRQRTLQHALAWSYDLLAPEEQVVFRRLGVFRGGWTLAAAEAVVGAVEAPTALEGMASLLDKSLIFRDARGSLPRYGMLETVREFACAQLVLHGEIDASAAQHAAYFLGLVEQGNAWPQDRKPSWYDMLEDELPNLREAMAFLDRSGSQDHLGRLLRRLAGFWIVRAHAAETLPYLEGVLAQAAGPTVTRAQILRQAGDLAYACGLYAKAEGWLQEGQALARDLGEATLAAECMVMRGAVAEHLGDEVQAQAFFEAGYVVAQDSGDAWLQGLCLANLSDAAYRRGEFDNAERYAREGAVALATLPYPYLESMNAGNLAQVLLARGAVREAAAAFVQALDFAEAIESRWVVADGLNGAAAISAALGQHEQAARLLGSADAERVRSGHPRLPHFGLFHQTDDTLKAILDERVFATHWERGRATNVTTAVSEAHRVLHTAALTRT